MGILLYFFAGLFSDIIITYYWLQIKRQSVIGSGIMAFVVTIFGNIILQRLILSQDFSGDNIAFGIGCGIGTMIVVHYDKKRKIK